MLSPSPATAYINDIAGDRRPETTAHELLSCAIEWQQYIRGISEFVADVMYEDEAVKNRHVAIALEAIGSLAKMSVECTMEAHSQMCREQLRLATELGGRRAGQTSLA